MAGELRVVPVSQVPWDDVRTVFGTRGDPAGCWCQYFKLSGAQWKSTSAAQNEGMLCEQIRDIRPAPGMLAYVGDEPVGWCAIEPRTAYPRVLSSSVIVGSPEPLDDDSVWAVTCFVVRVGHRRRGIGSGLLRAAVEHARQHGARTIEAYPVDTGGSRISSADLYHGSLGMFEAAGFETIARPIPGRAVVRLRP